MSEVMTEPKLNFRRCQCCCDSSFLKHGTCIHPSMTSSIMWFCCASAALLVHLVIPPSRSHQSFHVYTQLLLDLQKLSQVRATTYLNLTFQILLMLSLTPLSLLIGTPKRSWMTFGLNSLLEEVRALPLWICDKNTVCIQCISLVVLCLSSWQIVIQYVVQ